MHMIVTQSIEKSRSISELESRDIATTGSPMAGDLGTASMHAQPEASGSYSATVGQCERKRQYTGIVRALEAGHGGECSGRLHCGVAAAQGGVRHKFYNVCAMKE